MKNRTKSELRNAASPSGILSRLRNDVAGNTLILVALATVPLVGLIGAGVDVSRTYLVKSRLQQACDAGVLAGRKFMTTNALSTAASTQAENYFANNFPTGAFGSKSISFTPTANSSGAVTATAKASVPATVMTAFGNGDIPLSVTCSADLEIANVDAMFVLDTTGSMRCDPDGTDCDSDSTSKIAGLRSAVVTFYDQLASVASAGSTIRYGFVPYSMGVNVGGSLPANYLVDSWTYQSRAANMTTPITSQVTGPATILPVEISSTTRSQKDCGTWGTNNGVPTVTSGTAPNQIVTTYSNVATTAKDWGWAGAPVVKGTNRSCRRNRTQKTLVTVTSGFRFTNWTYGPTVYDVSGYKSGTSVDVAISQPTGYVATSGRYNLLQLGASTTASSTEIANTWAGNGRCIEERDTVAQASFGTVPATAYDLDIDLIPTSNETKWRPAFADLIYERTTQASETTTTEYGPEYGDCPNDATKLTTMTKSQVQAYVNALIPDGNTYHDFGMIWGARFVSPTGIFGSENATAANGGPISRNIIFMTDGIMSNNPVDYSTYGYEIRDNRIAPAGSDGTTLAARHTARFLAACQAARAKNVTVWVIAFGTSLSNDLRSCADPGKAFEASNTTTLITQFQQIAARIADLRLTQ